MLDIIDSEFKVMRAHEHDQEPSFDLTTALESEAELEKCEEPLQFDFQPYMEKNSRPIIAKIKNKV